MKKLILKKGTIRQLEFILAVIGLMFYTGALTYFFQVIVKLRILNTLIRYSILLVSLLGIVLNLKEAKKVCSRGWVVFPLIILSVLSFLWSANPGVTIQSLRSDFIPINLFAIYLTVRFSRASCFKLFYLSVLIISLISLFYGFFLPSIGRHPINDIAYPGAWRGIFGHKNGFGYNLTLTNVFLGIQFLDYRHKKPWINWLISGILMAGTLASESLSALVISGFALGVTWIYCRNYRWQGKPTLLFLQIFLMSVVAISVMISVFWNPLFTALGKDPTLSSRTLIWDYVLSKVAQSPILGFGKSAFWKVPYLFVDIWRTAHHVPPHAHNGYVDLLAELGYVGLFCFLIALIPVLIKVLRLAYGAVNIYDIWPLSFMVVFLVGNYVESVLLRGASFSWLIFVVIACSDFSRPTNLSSSK